LQKHSSIKPVNLIPPLPQGIHLQNRDAPNLTFLEGRRFLPETEPIAPSPYLAEFLAESIPLAIATGSEKARSELIISPILFEVRKILDRHISFFSGEDFTVDVQAGLSGICDFLISRSPEQLLIEAPAIVIVEAKKENLISCSNDNLNCRYGC
jgi:hypothetical protein